MSIAQDTNQWVQLVENKKAGVKYTRSKKPGANKESDWQTRNEDIGRITVP